MMEPENRFSHYLKYLIPVVGVNRMTGAAPKPYRSAELGNWHVLAVLEGMSTVKNTRDGIEGERYFQAALMDICDEYEVHTGLLPGSVSPKLMGTVLRGLALTLIRRKDGYKVLWTKRQLSILADYIKE